MIAITGFFRLKQVQTSTGLPVNGSDSGMTLIDLAVFMTVLGLLAVPLIQKYNNDRIFVTKQDSVNRLGIIRQSLSNFYFENNRYPCPSDITLNTNNPNYGHETCTGGGPVRQGGVPFADLKLPIEAALDAWNNRLLYAVTSAQNVAPVAPAPFPVGVITVRQPACGPDPDGINIICDLSLPPTQINNGHWVIVSHGPKGVGARSAEGVLVEICPAAGGPRSEKENCDGNSIFYGLFGTSAHSDIKGSAVNDNYNDDIVLYGNQTFQRIWIYSPLTTALQVQDTITAYLSVGINNPNPQTEVDVMGNILTTNNAADPTDTGNLNTAQMCDRNGDNCMDPGAIGGVNRINCQNSPGQAGLRGIRQNTGSCLNGYLQTATSSCPAGKKVTGFDAVGKVICN